MRQIVFLKQVPASTEVRLDPETHTLVRSGSKARTNPDDLHALRMAVEIKERTGGSVVAVSMGPPQAVAVLKEALMNGADEAILLSDRVFAGSDTWSTGYVLSAAVRKIGAVDLLLFGKQAIDGDTAQVGPGVAAQLNMPQLTEVLQVEEVSLESITVLKTTDRGTQLLRAAYPCALTVSKEANSLPAPSLRDWERSEATQVTHWSAADLDLDVSLLGLSGSPTRVVRTSVPDERDSIVWLNTTEGLSSLLKQLIS